MPLELAIYMLHRAVGIVGNVFLKKMKKEKRKEELWGMQNFKEVIEEGNFR